MQNAVEKIRAAEGGEKDKKRREVAASCCGKFAVAFCSDCNKFGQE